MKKILHGKTLSLKKHSGGSLTNLQSLKNMLQNLDLKPTVSKKKHVKISI